MSQQFPDIEVPDPLMPPVSRNFLAGRSPDLFRIIFEKGLIELAAETIDKKFRQVIFRPEGKEPGPGIGKRDPACFSQSQIAYRRPIDPESCNSKKAPKPRHWSRCMNSNSQNNTSAESTHRTRA